MRFFPANRLILALACLSLLLARLDGAHLHLCFDGNEPATSVHAMDDGYIDLHPEAGTKHEDQDVSLVGSLLAKQDKANDLIPILALALVVLALVSQLVRRTPVPAQSLLIPAPLFAFRPPLRGPPA